MLMAVALTRHFLVAERHQADTAVMIGRREAASIAVRRILVMEPACRNERCKTESLNTVGRNSLNQNSSSTLNSTIPDRLMIGNSSRSKVRRDLHKAHCHRSNRQSKNRRCDGGDDVRRKSFLRRFLHRGVHDVRVSGGHDAAQNRPQDKPEWLPEPAFPGEVGGRIWR